MHGHMAHGHKCQAYQKRSVQMKSSEPYTTNPKSNTGSYHTMTVSRLIINIIMTLEFGGAVGLVFTIIVTGAV